MHGLRNCRFWAICLLAAAIVSGCVPSQAAPSGITPSATPEPAPALSQAPSPTATPSAEPTATPLPLPERTQYRINAVLDYAQRELRVSQEIHYVNRSGNPLSELVLGMDVLVYPGVVRLDQLNSLEGPALGEFNETAPWLNLPLQEPLPPDAKIALRAQYSLRLPDRVTGADQKPMIFGWSERQVNLVDWFLYVPARAPEGDWLAHERGYYGEYQVYESSDFDIQFEIVNAPPELFVAASAPALMEGNLRHYHLERARTFALTLSPSAQRLSQRVEGVEIQSVFFPGHEAAGQAVLDTAAQALTLYSQRFAPYPFATLTVVEADFLDGMEFDGLVFLSNAFYNLYDGKSGSYLVALAAHETAHQWWFSLVGNDQAFEPWLDEALCTYAEHLYYEEYAPEALEWWLAARVLFYQPAGAIDISIYNPQRSLQPYRAYRDQVYLHGALFFLDLKALMGDEAFFAALADYTHAQAGRIANATDFFNTIRAHTDQDLTALREKYFTQP